MTWISAKPTAPKIRRLTLGWKREPKSLPRGVSRTGVAVPDWIRNGCAAVGGQGDPVCASPFQGVNRPKRGYRNVDAAVYDWSVFWNETAADYINRMARLVNDCDSTRKTVTYLTFSFAYPAEWDYTQYYAIAPDEVAMRGRDVDVFGLQVCSADGDPYRVTACLDLVRKYGKPVWAVDLVDFTSGVQIGYPTLDRVTHSAIQHGNAGSSTVRGIFHRCSITASIPAWHRKTFVRCWPTLVRPPPSWRG